MHPKAKDEEWRRDDTGDAYPKAHSFTQATIMEYIMVIQVQLYISDWRRAINTKKHYPSAPEAIAVCQDMEKDFPGAYLRVVKIIRRQGKNEVITVLYP